MTPLNQRPRGTRYCPARVSIAGVRYSTGIDASGGCAPDWLRWPLVRVRPGREWRERSGVMTAQSVHDYGPDDPVEILHVLPSRFHEQFLAEYEAAVDGRLIRIFNIVWIS
jgi:hypothetical protein